MCTMQISSLSTATGWGGYSKYVGFGYVKYMQNNGKGFVSEPPKKDGQNIP